LVSPFDDIGSRIEQEGILEGTLSEIVRDSARRGFDYVDVGANIGVHLCAFGLAAQTTNREDWRALAFEPEPSLFRTLVANCDLNGLSQIVCRKVGLAEKEGSAPLFLSNTSNKGNNSFVRHKSICSDAVECLLSTMDCQMSGLDVTRALVKIDAEGYEGKVLLGGREWLRCLSDAVVILEIFPSLLEQAGGSASAVSDLLRRIGFGAPLLVHDPDTIDSGGTRRGTVYNLLYAKGPIADEAVGNWSRQQWLVTQGAAGWSFENP
jgi:FkbM family methyltransferase